MTDSEILDWLYANCDKMEMRGFMVFIFWIDNNYNDRVSSGMSIRQAVERACGLIPDI